MANATPSINAIAKMNHSNTIHHPSILAFGIFSVNNQWSYLIIDANGNCHRSQKLLFSKMGKPIPHSQQGNAIFLVHKMLAIAKVIDLVAKRFVIIRTSLVRPMATIIALHLYPTSI